MREATFAYSRQDPMTISDLSMPTMSLADIWQKDASWKWMGPALALAAAVHGAAFFAMSGAPAKPLPQTISMAINLPPPPPPPPKPPDPPKKKVSQATPPPAPSAAPLDIPPPQDTPPPLSTAEPIALGPTTGMGVAVPVGTPDGVAGAAPVSGSGPPPQTTRAQAGPPPPAWDPNGYKSDAWDMMNKAKRYPRKAEVLGLEGKCIIKVLINHDGSLAARPSIVGKGTGHAALDEECIAMADRVKFPPIPAHIEAPVTYRFPVEFHLLNR